ncbi:FAD-binding protein [Sphingomonas jatrophae]|uniref:Succinate dehydrogenase/fumarate reductase, flavoprotein subunit n=1 Tax=Sphingomonas jatrophae TaxID=1166337 RepID=A0A1I6KFG5_9SPHN|nr:FAD-binding protein [Sphingomonas jatrophae]SFR89894.1 Succinate dehydrogenase/fumarate reductase, flavoprotein subunit [Sphingomonas jatrophae]
MPVWDEECDVLVVGSGAGGMTGAYTAAREGLRVILAEATDRFGGTSAYSGGGMWFPCNAVLRRAGDDDTMEDARDYYRAVVGDRTPRDVQDAYLETGRKLIDYLEQDPGFEFIVYPWPDYYGRVPKARESGRHIMPMSLDGAALGDLRGSLRAALGEERRGQPAPEMLDAGQALIGRFLLALSKMPNAALRLRHELVEFVREGDRVTGAVMETPEGVRRIRAHAGIVVAAGGFEHDAELRARFGVAGDVAGAMGPPGNKGLALKAGMAIGADVDLMDQAWWSPGLMQPDGTASFTLGFDGGIFVDQDGRRFINESLPYDRAGREIIARVKEGRLTLPFWLVYDDRDGGMPPIQFPNLPFAPAEDYRAAGLWRSAPTLSGLADAIGVPADALAATVERHNCHAERGEDPDFERGVEAFDRMFTGGAVPLAPIARPPFHAAAFGLSDLGTKGGMRTDARARVLDGEGRVIPGLYAAGNSMAAVSGEAYPGGGNPIGSSMVFAYLAARDMAAER